ncbi:MAG: LON peptidase substrate-binding domain-containing protein [Actinomycetota bacterium]|nr:LON peptidase substrate-binding domain-containing protein [Actinomycetota bacterium]
MELPLFPLRVVLFPGRPLPLHVFEPRYRRMLGDCLRGGRRFGVVAIRSGCETDPDAEIHDVGTVAGIEAVEERADGRYNIATRGGQRFRVRRLLPAAPYPRAEVELLADPPVAPGDADRARALRGLLGPYLLGLGAPEELLAHLPEEPVHLGWLASAAVQVELSEQQRLLEADSVGGRLDATVQMLRREMGLTRHFGMVGSLQPAGPNGADLN